MSGASKPRSATRIWGAPRTSSVSSSRCPSTRAGRPGCRRRGTTTGPACRWARGHPRQGVRASKRTIWPGTGRGSGSRRAQQPQPDLIGMSRPSKFRSGMQQSRSAPPRKANRHRARPRRLQDAFSGSRRSQPVRLHVPNISGELLGVLLSFDSLSGLMGRRRCGGQEVRCHSR